MQEVLIQRPLPYDIPNFHGAILHDFEKWSRLFSISIENSLILHIPLVIIIKSNGRFRAIFFVYFFDTISSQCYFWTKTG